MAVDRDCLIEFKHLLYNYMYQQSNIRLAGMMLDVEVEKGMFVFYLTAPAVAEGVHITTKLPVKDIVDKMDGSGDTLNEFCGCFYDTIMEQIINSELEYKEIKEEEDDDE